MSTEDIRLIKDGEKRGKWVWRWEKREGDYIPVATLSPPESCFKVGSDECHFNVSLIVRDKVTRQCSQTTRTFEENGEPKRIRTEVPLIAQRLTARSNRLTLLSPEQAHCALMAV